MSKAATLTPRLNNSLKKAGLRSWVLDVPPTLSWTGKRQRLYFETRKAADARADELRAHRINFGRSLAQLSPAQLSKATEAFSLLEPQEIDLVDAVRGYLQIHAERQGSIPFGQLFEKFVAAKPGRNPDYLRQLRWVQRYFAFLNVQLASDIITRQLEEAVAALSPSIRNFFIRVLKAVLSYGVRLGYLRTNPASRLELTQIVRNEVEIFTPHEVERLLSHALEHDLGFLPYRVFTFFCGIRPAGEVGRLSWTNVNLRDRIVILPATITKAKRRRIVDIADNAVAWLECYRVNGGKTIGLVAPFTRAERGRRHEANWQGAGLSRWIQQGARHSYCSYWLAEHGDINRLVLQSGHRSVDVMWRHYHRAATAEEARAFWSIMPPATSATIIAFQKDMA
jgi:integrase